MRVGSLFSGIGGFDEGFRLAEMKTVWACEKDSQARAVFRSPFYTPIYPNIKEIDPDAVEPVDLLCGGFPCQDLSVAGKRQGLAGERSGLFYEIVRIVDGLSQKPRWIVLENVPGLLSSHGGRDMEAVVRALAELGYGVCWRVLDSQYLGVPQRRRRVFFVGYLGDWRPAFQVLFEREGLCGHPAPSREKREEVAGSLGASVKGYRNDLDGCGAFIAAFGGNNTSGPIDVATACRAKGGTGHGDFESETFVCVTGTRTHALTRRMDSGEDGTGRGTPIVVNARQDPCTYGNQSGALDQDQGTYAVAHGMRVRRLTPTECERLQGFPDGWTAWGVNDQGKRVEMVDGPRYRMLGNAVTVNVAEYIGRAIMAADSNLSRVESQQP